jgi:hypothetical protein
MSSEYQSVVPIDLSVRSVRLSRRQIRELLKEVAVFYCNAPVPVTVRGSLLLVARGLGDPQKAPCLAALLEFAKLPGAPSIPRAPEDWEGEKTGASNAEASDPDQDCWCL